MSEFYHPGQRQLQDRFDSRRLADRMLENVVYDCIYDRDIVEQIQRADMFFLATADEQGRPTCSYKGGEPGFVRVLDERHLAFPSYDGNGMFMSLGNLNVNPHVGLLFVDFERARRLRIQGSAEACIDDPLLAEYHGAQLVVRVTTREVFINCPRYVHKYQLVERSKYVPRAGVSTPTAPWKGEPWANDALPAGDPARDPKDR